MSTIFEKSSELRLANGIVSEDVFCDLDSSLLRQDVLRLAQMSELDVVRHFTRLSQQNFSIDGQFYPLGSCTMKYNPKIAHQLALLDGFKNRHPYQSILHSQGVLHCLYELQCMIAEITGMDAVSLSPMAGAQGEFSGVSMIKAYHQSRGDMNRDEFLVPDAAHGTNPATAVMCGFKVKEIPTKENGDIDLSALKAACGEKTAGIMLTNPSTCGVFERQIVEVAKTIHQAGGLLYYDGANLNAILGKVKPGEMGFDVMHLNLHKTFATPHGGGGPGAGPVAANARLAPFLPVPQVGIKDEKYDWLTIADKPQSIGQLSTFMGNVGILLRAYIYAAMLGKEGMHRVAEFAVLNANYLQTQLQAAGFTLAFPQRRATHEFIVTLKSEAKTYQLTATDLAKRLLDDHMHAPTVYFPLLIPECLLIEPTETESKATLDAFVDSMVKILQEAKEDISKIKQAPQKMPVKRLDDVKAARELDLAFKYKVN